MSDRKRPREGDDLEESRKQEERVQRILDIMEVRYNRMQEALCRFAELTINWAPPGTQPVQMARAFQIGHRLMTMDMMAGRLAPIAAISDHLRYVNVAVIKDFDQFEKECIEHSKQVIQDLIAVYRGQVCLLTLANSQSLDDTNLEKLIAENPVVGETVFDRLKEFRSGSVFKELQTIMSEKKEECEALLSKVEQPSQDHTPVESNPESAPPAIEP